MYKKSDIYQKTIYGKDYTVKKGNRPKAATFHVEYPDTISGPYNEYLVHIEFPNLLPKDAKYEHHDGIAKRTVEKIPALKPRFIDDPANMHLIQTKYFDVNRTLYQVDYCKVNDFDSPKKKARGVIPIPDDWLVPMTTYRKSYRGPAFVPPGLPGSSMDITPRRAAKPPDNIKPCKITPRYVRILTGNSEYQVMIGKLGESIMTDKYHGTRKESSKEPAWELDLKEKLLMQYKPQYQETEPEPKDI